MFEYVFVSGTGHAAMHATSRVYPLFDATRERRSLGAAKASQR
jgi:hypothetical protein